jgi:hypothetical protein
VEKRKWIIMENEIELLLLEAEWEDKIRKDRLKAVKKYKRKQRIEKIKDLVLEIKNNMVG